MLTVDWRTGRAKLKNSSPFSVTLEGYSILSDQGSLQPANGDWNSLADHGLNGWQEAGPTTAALSELNPTSGLLLASGTEIDLGELYDSTGQPDLQLLFSLLNSNTTMAGVVIYTPGLLATTTATASSTPPTTRSGATRWARRSRTVRVPMAIAMASSTSQTTKCGRPFWADS